jgi:pyruvate dehydrogenase E2 component (dihydrolipoamide acetyltransferase)
LDSLYLQHPKHLYNSSLIKAKRVFNMALEFKFPDVGEGIQEGEIVKWHVKEGDIVKADQSLVDVETDKAIVTIPTPRAGQVLKINVLSGSIKVGSILCIIGDKGEKYTPQKVEEKKKKGSVTVIGELPEATEAKQREIPKIAQVKARFATRKLAKELNVDIFSLQGTGQDNLITDDDVKKAAGHTTNDRAHIPQKTAPLPQNTKLKVSKKYDIYGKLEHHPLKGIRKTIADNMVKSLFTIPHVTHMDEADVTDLVELVIKEKAKRKFHLTYLPFVIQALIATLKKHPAFNASLDSDASEIIYKKYFNFGIAVDTDHGLMVPIIKRADQKKISDLAKEIIKLAEACRNRTIDLGDLKGGTISITNIGAYGGIYATPIIHMPETANLGIFRIKDQPRVIKDKIVIRKIMPLAVAFDHRVVDGGEAAKFMNDLKDFLENPSKLFKKVE